MTGTEHAGKRILGRLRSADGKGVVTVQDRFDTDIDDLWSAITDPAAPRPLAGRGRGRPPPRRRVPRALFPGQRLGRDRAGGSAASRRGGCWCGPWTTSTQASSSSRPR